MKVKIEQAAWDKIMTFTDLCPNEISGLGKITVIDGYLVVTDVAIFEQEVSGAHSNIEPRALAKFQHERIKAGESMKEWCFWWHSHANLTVFFSGTDTGTIESSTEFPYLVSLVVNKKHEYKARYDVLHPVHLFTDVDVEIIKIADDKLIDLCQKEIDKKVTHPKYEAPKQEIGFRRPWNQSNYDFQYQNEERQSPLQEQEQYFKKKRSLQVQLDYLKRNKKMKKEWKKKVEEMRDHVREGVKEGYEMTD